MNPFNLSWKCLKDAFKPYESWAGMQDENSDLMKFLKATCLDEKSPDCGPDMKFDSFRMRVLGLLWCEGSHEEKSIELYEICFDSLQSEIAAEDKNFATKFYCILDFCTSMVFK